MLVSELLSFPQNSDFNLYNFDFNIRIITVFS